MKLSHLSDGKIHKSITKMFVHTVAMMSSGQFGYNHYTYKKSQQNNTYSCVNKSHLSHLWFKANFKSTASTGTWLDVLLTRRVSDDNRRMRCQQSQHFSFHIIALVPGHKKTALVQQSHISEQSQSYLLFMEGSCYRHTNFKGPLVSTPSQLRISATQNCMKQTSPCALTLGDLQGRLCFIKRSK